MAEKELNNESSFDFLQEKFANKPKVNEPTSPNAFEIKDLTEDEALEMYLTQPDEIVFAMTGLTKDDLKAKAAERALNAEHNEKAINEKNTEKTSAAPTLQVETIDIDTEYINDNKDKLIKNNTTRQAETLGQTSSSLTNKTERRVESEKDDKGYTR